MKLFSSFCAIAVSGVVKGEKLTPVFGEEAVWSGDFENFDFDSFLEKSSSPLAAELLSLRDPVDPDVPLDDAGQIQLGQRGWFDDAYTREERRKKKLKQILKMVFFLQVCQGWLNLSIFLGSATILKFLESLYSIYAFWNFIWFLELFIVFMYVS